MGGLGALVTAAGLMLISPDPSWFALTDALVRGGAGFALGAGLVQASARRAGPIAVGLGLASLLLAVQAIGPVVEDSLTQANGGSLKPSLAIAATGAALVIMALFVLAGGAGRAVNDLA